MKLGPAGRVPNWLESSRSQPIRRKFGGLSAFVMSDLLDAAKHWDQLATEQDEDAAWEIRMGRSWVETYRNRAKMYRQTATELRQRAAAEPNKDELQCRLPGL